MCFVVHYSSEYTVVVAMDTELASTYSINDHKYDEQSVDSNVEIQTLREELDRINTEFLKVYNISMYHL